MSATPRRLLAGAAGCMAAFAVLMTLAYSWAPAEWLDGNALSGFVAARDSAVSHFANVFAWVCNPGPYALLVLPVLAYALIKRSPRRAAAAALLLLGANVSSQVLKPLLAHHRDLSAWPNLTQPSSAAFPSGHTTAAMSLAFAAVLVAPRAYRPIVATIGGAFALAVSVSILVLNWHYPSDVVGGQLLACTWCLVALAALRWSEARWPERGSMRRAAREAIVVPSPALLAVVAIVPLLLVATRAGQLLRFAGEHTSAVAVAGAIATSAILLLAAVTTLAARR
jgi:membrane-associated phospholipid phosphatase